MNWTELLKNELEAAYRTTEGLLDMVEDDVLDWKPATGDNWMTTGQLLRHIGEGCGMPAKGFVTGDWGMLPEDADMSQMTMEEMLPPASKMPTVSSVAEAKKLLAGDKQLALEMIDLAGEEKLAATTATAPWDPRELKLGHRVLQMVEHLKLHKAQLFYYLKLQGKPVNTGNLWGM